VLYRTILFYKLLAGKKISNSSTTQKLTSEEVLEMFRYIVTLETNLSNVPNRFIQVSRSPDKYMFMLVDGTFDEREGTLKYPIKGRLIFARKDDIAQWVYQDGSIKLPDLPPDVLGQGEITHFIVFNDGVVGIEYNPHGPRISKLCEYLYKIWIAYSEVAFDESAFELADVKYTPVPNERILQELIQKEVGLKLVTVSIDLTPALKELIKSENGPITGLTGIDNLKVEDENIGEVRIVLKAERGESMKSRGIYNFLRRIKRAKESEDANISRLKVTTELGQEVDLFNPVVKSRVGVSVEPLNDGFGRKVVKTSDMYLKIIESYGALVRRSSQ